MLARGALNAGRLRSARVHEWRNQLLQQGKQAVRLGGMDEALVQILLMFVPKFARQIPQQHDRLVPFENDGDRFIELVSFSHVWSRARGRRGGAGGMSA